MLRTFPWVLAAILAVVVWRDHHSSNLPWLLLAGATYAMGWFQGRRRPWSRRAPRRQAPRESDLWLRVPQTATEAPSVRRPVREVMATIEAPPPVVADLSSALVGLGFRAAQAKRVAVEVVARRGAGTDPSDLFRDAMRSIRAGSGPVAMVVR